jgi:hypothetical protein
MASQFGIVTALGMKNNVISCVYSIVYLSFSLLAEVVVFTVLTGISFDKVCLTLLSNAFIQLMGQSSYHVLA